MQMDPQEQIFEILFEKDDVTWKTIIMELIKNEEMDPWDINITKLTERYLAMLAKMKEADFRVSGKVLLAAAVLLKIKSNRLLGQDIDEFDRLFASPEEEEAFYEELEQEFGSRCKDFVPPDLVPRTPQPRKRKVSVYDLMAALHQALEVKKRRVERSIPPKNIEVPEKGIDIGEMIKNLYSRITCFFSANPGKSLMFSQLVPSDSKIDKVLTFIPLLHLTNQRRLNLEQQEHFGEIQVMLRSRQDAIEEIEREKQEPQADAQA
ncbi:hypothetical protein GF351_00330 [Candidatus Woesearchaeota archaeon]|nr:hypothetical protein [Candidatus Woesearchaeota archaeon]